MTLLNMINVFEILEYQDSYYSVGNYSFLVNEYAKHFDIRLFCKVKKVNSLPESNVFKLSDNVSCVSVFDTLSAKAVFFNMGKYIKRIKKYVKKNDLCYINYNWRYVSMFISYHMRKSNLIMYMGGDPTDWFRVGSNKLTSLFRCMVQPIYNFMYKSFTKIVSKGNLVFYSGNVFVDIKNHQNQFTTTVRTALNKDKSIIKKKKTFNIGFIGQETYQKEFPTMFKAIAKSKFSDRLKLNMIGLSSLKLNKNKKLAKKININFLGKIYEKKKFYQTLANNDILILSSVGERNARVMLEAMSVGVVPLITDTGGNYVTVENYYNGMLFGEYDYKDLAKKIDLLYTNPKLYETIKNVCVEHSHSLEYSKDLARIATIIKNYYGINR